MGFDQIQIRKMKIGLETQPEEQGYFFFPIKQFELENNYWREEVEYDCI